MRFGGLYAGLQEDGGYHSDRRCLRFCGFVPVVENQFVLQLQLCQL